MTGPIQSFDFSVDLLRHLLWQYNDAERLLALLKQKQAWYGTHQQAFWQGWIRDVFDLRTANDFGLAVWSEILGESRSVPVPDQGDAHPAFGFGPFRQNFGRSNFGRRNGAEVTLTTEQFRLLLRLRYFLLTSRGTVPEINAYLQRLFSEQGRVWVLDPLDMSFAVYVFSFEPNTWQRFVLEDLDALPRPAGVGVKIRVLDRPVFGFGAHHLNFRGGFAPMEAS